MVREENSALTELNVVKATVYPDSLEVIVKKSNSIPRGFTELGTPATFGYRASGVNIDNPIYNKQQVFAQTPTLLTHLTTNISTRPPKVFNVPLSSDATSTTTTPANNFRRSGAVDPRYPASWKPFSLGEELLKM